MKEPDTWKTRGPGGFSAFGGCADSGVGLILPALNDPSRPPLCNRGGKLTRTPTPTPVPERFGAAFRQGNEILPPPLADPPGLCAPLEPAVSSIFGHFSSISETADVNFWDKNHQRRLFKALNHKDIYSF